MRRVHTKDEKRKLVASIIAKKAKNSSETKEICKAHGIGYSTFCAWRVEVEKEEKDFEKSSVKKMLISLKNENKLLFKMISEIAEEVEKIKDNTPKKQDVSPVLSVVVAVDTEFNISEIQSTPKKGFWTKELFVNFLDCVSCDFEAPGVYSWGGRRVRVKGDHKWRGEWQRMNIISIPS